MIQSFVVYTIAALGLFALGYRLNTVPDCPLRGDAEGWRRFLPRWEFVAMVLIVALLLGLRFHTGYDHEMYRYEYRVMQRNGSFQRPDFEVGFWLVTWLFAKIGLHYTVYFAFWGGLQMALLCYGLRRHRFVLPWLGALLILSCYSLNWLTFMRQWTVACMFVVAVPLIRERRFWLYLLFVVFAMSIHRASVLLLPLYFLPYARISRWPGWVFPTLLVAFTAVGIYPVWMTWFSPVGDYLLIWGYEKYAYVLDPVLNGEFRFLPWGVLHILTFLMELLVVCAYPLLRQKHKNDTLLPYFFVLGLIGVYLENLFNNTVYFLTRPLDFVAVFVLIIVAYICHDLLVARRRWLLAGVCVLSMSYMYCNVVKSYMRNTPEKSVVFYHFVTDDPWLFLENK